MRVAAILTFAAAAVVVGVGRSSDNRLLVALGALLFLVGVGIFFRWRGTVLDPKAKTPPEE